MELARSHPDEELRKRLLSFVPLFVCEPIVQELLRLGLARPDERWPDDQACISPNGRRFLASFEADEDSYDQVTRHA
jgi:hypothetical protein